MKVTGVATLNQPPEGVWAALNDARVLARAIPGCERLETTGPGACALTVVAGIAAVAGSYAVQAQATERTAPDLIRAIITGSGNRGRVDADVTVRLARSGDAATDVSYEAEIRVQGPVAAVGQLVLASVAKRLASQFLSGIERALAAPAAADAAAGDALAEPALVAAGSPAPVSPPVTAGVCVPDSARPPVVSGGVRAGLLAGAAAGIAGLAVGLLLGRRIRTSR